MIKQRRDNSASFSLLEVMAVITIILLLTTFSVAYIRAVMVHGRAAVLREDLFTLRSQIDRFTHDYERYPDSLEELVEKGYMGSLPTDPFTGSSQTWHVDMQDEPFPVDGFNPASVASLHSGSIETNLDGSAYSTW